jgi:hypothetical protein
VRENDGFKNVSLGNMLRAYLATPPGEHITFLEADVQVSRGLRRKTLYTPTRLLTVSRNIHPTSQSQELYRNTVSASFDVQVGLHELLGHGSGKLFTEAKDGTYVRPCARQPPRVGAPATALAAEMFTKTNSIPTPLFFTPRLPRFTSVGAVAISPMSPTR